MTETDTDQEEGNKKDEQNNNNGQEDDDDETVSSFVNFFLPFFESQNKTFLTHIKLALHSLLWLGYTPTTVATAASPPQEENDLALPPL